MTGEELAAVKARYETFRRLSRETQVESSLTLTRANSGAVLSLHQRLLDEDIPALLEEVERRRAENRALRKAGKALLEQDEAQRAAISRAVEIAQKVLDNDEKE